MFIFFCLCFLCMWWNYFVYDYTVKKGFNHSKHAFMKYLKESSEMPPNKHYSFDDLPEDDIYRAILPKWSHRFGRDKLTWVRVVLRRHSCYRIWRDVRFSFLSLPKYKIFVCFRYFLSNIGSCLASCNCWRKPEYPAKTTAKPQVTGDFLTRPEWDSNPDNGER